MTVTITTLVENTSGAPYIHGEWGQSLLVETSENTILFDTGPGDLITANAERLGVDLGKVDKIVLSHGHYDHTGGLQAVLLAILESGAKPDGIEIVAHPHVFQDKFIYIKDLVAHPIGMPFSRDDLEGLGARFNLSAKPVQLNSFSMTTGKVQISVDHEKIDATLHVQKGEAYIPDELADDLGIIIKTEKGLVLLLGCAHRGLINTITHARKLTGIDKVYAVIGGTHLISAGPEQLTTTVAALKEMKIEKLGTSHCTGLVPASILAHEFKGSFFFNSAGTKTIL
jgi:7,8-dihydropterin-6-yl-methyl-4-(beta-D-ribofuranosyl)aminobenzene 5'-phosphate synthase